MTDKERDLGRVISVSILLLIILIAMFSSCSPYYYQSKGPKVTHVLALTEDGDTLKIPIKDIKPNVIYNVVGYDWYRPYSGYYPYYHPHLYNSPKPINNGNSSYINNNSNNTPNITTPTIKPEGLGINPPPPPINPRKKN